VLKIQDQMIKCEFTILLLLSYSNCRPWISKWSRHIYNVIGEIFWDHCNSSF